MVDISKLRKRYGFTMNVFTITRQQRFLILIIVGLVFLALIIRYQWNVKLSSPSAACKMSAQASSSPPSLKLESKKFCLDGKPIRLLSGAVHYFRIMPEYWEDRLMKLKACGLNTVETYVPWNYHEEVRGKFNFGDGLLNVRKFIQLAHKLGLYVIFRPGPFICSEWEFGGLPSWLLRDKTMRVRSTYKPYLDAVDDYFSQLIPQVSDLQYSKGGPIIAVQVENEYGSYGDDVKYMEFVKQSMEKHGIVELFFTSDNDQGIDRGKMPGVLMTANFDKERWAKEIFYHHIRKENSTWPLMAMEFWSGWFDHWGERHHTPSLGEFENTLRYILSQGGSVNFYMFHGGTNFGFMNGANGPPYQPTISSYDYDAPLSEHGAITRRYEIIKKVLKEMVPGDLPPVIPDLPAPIPKFAYGTKKILKMMPYTSILETMQAISSPTVKPMELLDINEGSGQSYGFIVYRNQIDMGGKQLKLPGHVRDRAQILVDGKEAAILDWSKRDQVTTVTATKPSTLDILVENCGRVNYADFGSKVLDDQRKGLAEQPLIDNQPLNDWKIYPLEFKENFIKSILSSDKWQQFDSKAVDGPSLYRTEFNIDGKPQDTFINMEGWTKGIVFVNNFNLGRYWKIGPTGTMYIPAPLLKTGENQIIVFELHSPNSVVILEDNPQLG